MKAVMVMFDSLNRHMLPPYGCDWVHAPNFARLANRAVTFDRAFVGSMPCMPARRELHTGRLNFLHRSWGPLEPFDDSTPNLLKDAGVYTHLVSDHFHYWEDGGCTYHTRYNTWEIVRGQQGDPWKPSVADPEIPECLAPRGSSTWRQDWVNRSFMAREADQPQAVTFTQGLDFIERNHEADNWFLHIETFDPHEPWFTSQHYKDLYPDDYTGPHFDWPIIRPVEEGDDVVRHARYENAALIGMCDAWLGKVLEAMDRHDLWRDTLLIVNTDHGYLLGEHGWWAKCSMPFYNEVARIPLFIWDPRCPEAAGQRRKALVQTIDLPATLLEYFGVDLPAGMQGVPLRNTLRDDTPVREACLFGIHGGHVNVTDGRYVYMRAPADPSNRPLFEYTLMPTHMRSFFELENELQHVELSEPFSFTKGCRLMKTPGRTGGSLYEFGTMLFDIEADPQQQTPIDNPAIEHRMLQHLARLMTENDAPLEQFRRLGVAAAR